MIQLLFRNLGWKIFSLALAFALWVTFVGSPELATTIAVPIEFQNLPNNLEMVSNIPERVHLEIRGPRSRLRGDLSGTAVILSLADVHDAGERTFTIGPNNVSLPFGLKLVRAVPGQLRIEFDQRLTRQVPVRVRFAGPPPRGYRVRQEQVDPAYLTIVGPDSRSKETDYAETDPVDISQTVSQAEFRVHAFLRDPQVRFVSSPVVRVKVVLVASVAQGNSK